MGEFLKHRSRFWARFSSERHGNSTSRGAVDTSLEGADGSAGFTLLELIIVLTIAGLAASVAASSFRGDKGGVRLRPLTSVLAADLRLARTRAIAQNHVTSFVYEPQSRTYRVDGAKVATRVPETMNLKMTTAGATSGNGAVRMEFFPDGSSSGGQIVLTDKGGASAILTVQWLTGAIGVKWATN